jgi:hypothetical protein
MDPKTEMSVYNKQEAQMDDLLLEDRVFDPDVLVEFSCAICLHLLSEPRQCSYGHNICLKCFQDLAKYPHLRSECPTCRTPMDKLQPNRNLVLENILAKLDVYCRVRYASLFHIEKSMAIHICSEYQTERLSRRLKKGGELRRFTVGSNIKKKNSFDAWVFFSSLGGFFCSFSVCFFAISLP